MIIIRLRVSSLSFQTTYEELKLLEVRYYERKNYSFQTTYEELKLVELPSI